MATCGVLRYLALRVRPEEYEDLVQRGLLIVAERVQAASKHPSESWTEGQNRDDVQGQGTPESRL
jgi:hypothetical protein